MAEAVRDRREYSRAYYEKHGARQRAKQKDRYHSDPEYRQRALDRERKKLYGITPEQFAAMIEAQDGTCAVCKRRPLGTKSLCVDHCHTTGKIRGLLCTACNVALGHLAEDLERIAALAAYVLRHSEGDD